MSLVLNGTTGISGTNALTGVTGVNSGQVGGSRNKIINGAIEINQRGTAAVAVDQGFPSDRWKTAETGGGNMTCQVVADAPASFRNSIKVIASTADDCSQAADEYRIFQRIEGNNVVDLYYGASGAKTTTLSFWVKSSLTGNFPVGLENSASNRSLVKQYNIAQADTWEKKSVTFVGDETGTWLITNGIGLGVSFVLGAGSNYTNTIDAWQAARVYRGSSSVQMMATINATWFVTGVQLEVGSTATDFEYRGFTDELALCQRYYWRATAGVTYALFASSTCEGTTSSVGGLVKHPVTMRASPTCTVGPALSNVRLYDGEGASEVTGYGGNWSTTDTWGQALAASGGGLTRGRGVMVQANNSTAAYIDATAEL